MRLDTAKIAAKARRTASRVVCVDADGHLVTSGSYRILESHTHVVAYPLFSEPTDQDVVVVHVVGPHV